MAWSENESRRRVRAFLQQTPKIAGALPTYSGGDLRVKQRAMLREAAKSGPLDRLSPDTAIVVDAVHVYVRLLGFDEQLLEQSRETEASHRRALSFLHFYYGALDRIVADGGGIRVDFHAARLHFIVAEPAGQPHARERIERALAIVEALEEVAAAAPKRLQIGVQRAPLRVGVDHGPCIAIANDSGHEMDPVFLGTPANLAAKLADGDGAGLFLSPAARAALGLPIVAGASHEAPISVRLQARALGQRIAQKAVDLWEQNHVTIGEAAANFIFHSTSPPLSDVKFAELKPSYSVRMEMAAIFADIDKFTAYVDQALKTGSGAEVVRTMFVLREEQRAVLKRDMGAKRLRFIGDCVVGLLAEGSTSQTDAIKTIEQAVLCAAALHGSLEVCRQEMPEAQTLSLQVGIAYGQTPMTRLGLRGEHSVRCAASKAVIDAERLQGVARQKETRLAPSAICAAGARVKRVAGDGGAITASYAALAVALGAENATSAQDQPEPFRAHAE
ncbi:MAG: hypothetical protein ACK4X1_13530 [Terricaulis sp.]